MLGNSDEIDRNFLFLNICCYLKNEPLLHSQYRIRGQKLKKCLVPASVRTKTFHILVEKWQLGFSFRGVPSDDMWERIILCCFAYILFLKFCWDPIVLMYYLEREKQPPNVYIYFLWIYFLLFMFMLVINIFYVFSNCKKME